MSSDSGLKKEFCITITITGCGSSSFVHFLPLFFKACGSFWWGYQLALTLVSTCRMGNSSSRVVNGLSNDAWLRAIWARWWGEKAAEDGIINLEVGDLRAGVRIITLTCVHISVSVLNWFLKVCFPPYCLHLPCVSEQNLRVRSPKDCKDQMAKNSLEGQSPYAGFYSILLKYSNVI